MDCWNHLTTLFSILNFLKKLHHWVAQTLLFYPNFIVPDKATFLNNLKNGFMNKSITVYIAFLLLLAVACFPIAILIFRILNSVREVFEQDFVSR